MLFRWSNGGGEKGDGAIAQSPAIGAAIREVILAYSFAITLPQP
jgi:hypothetical protein